MVLSSANRKCIQLTVFVPSKYIADTVNGEKNVVDVYLAM